MRLFTLSLVLLAALVQTAAAAAKSITCSYASGQQLSFDVPKKLGGLPAIEFDYPSKVTEFSFRDDNLLLVAIDETQKSRVRIVISAQRRQGKTSYDGQILTDSGGNQIMLDNGPVSCKASGQLRSCWVGKAKRAHRAPPHRDKSGGHGASAPLPTLRLIPRIEPLTSPRSSRRAGQRDLRSSLGS